MTLQSQFSAALAHLLYENEQVHLPGLGAFVLQYKPAIADAVQGQVQPPSREVQFNANLVIDDGVLAHYLHEKQGIPLAEAQSKVNDFILQMKATLDKKEIVEITGIGRFYLDYENKLRFLTDSGNYDKNSFGLPAIQAYPVIRQATTPKPTSVDEKKVHTTRPTLSWASLWPRYAAWISGLAILFLLVLIYAIWPTATPIAEGSDLANTPNEQALPLERLNVSPSEQPAADKPTAETDAPPAEEEEPTPPEAPNEGRTTPDPEERDSPTLAPGTHTAIVAIGMFGNTENASRLTRRLSQAGFEPYSAREGKMTRVGVQLTYETEHELQNDLREIKAQFGSGAFVLLKDGKRLR